MSTTRDEPATGQRAQGLLALPSLVLVLVLVLVGMVAPPVRASASTGATAVSTSTHTFQSEDWLHPPTVSVSGTDPDPALGDIFADVENSVQDGPLILSPQGQLIYFQPLSGMRAFNLEVQQYQGQSVLTYWQGVGVRTGHGVILNHSYQQIAAVYAGNGYSADAHEFQITPQGDALITIYAPVRANLSSIGGPRHGTLMDSIIQEIDIATGAVLWEWHASGHVGLRQTHAGTPGRWPYDFFHINSIQQLPDGNLLISARYTWALYEISMSTGRIVRVIGGEQSSFKMGPGTNFEWQHDAAMQPDGTITLFDNASNGSSTDETRSRGLRIRLNSKTRRASLVSAYISDPPLLSTSQGSVQALPDGNAFVGWGSSGYFTELGPRGRQLFSLHFHFPLESYRGYRFQWWGQPTTPPSVAATATSTGTTVYASWNGATDAATWQVLAGASAASLTPVGEYPDSSFETTMATTTTLPYVEARALDSGGNVLGTSATIER